MVMVNFVSAKSWLLFYNITRRPADSIQLFYRSDLLDKRLPFQISGCIRNQDKLHNQQDC